MIVKRPYEDPRALVLLQAIRSKYNVWGWTLVGTIILLNLLILTQDYRMMRKGALETTDYKIIGHEVEERDGYYYIAVDIENHSAEECKPWITKIKSTKGDSIDLLSAQRYFRFRSANGSINPATAIPPQARGRMILELKKQPVEGIPEICLTFDNLDITELKVKLP